MLTNKPVLTSALNSFKWQQRFCVYVYIYIPKKLFEVETRQGRKGKHETRAFQYVVTVSLIHFTTKRALRSILGKTTYPMLTTPGNIDKLLWQ